MTNYLSLDFEEISEYFIKCETQYFTLRTVFTPKMDSNPAFFQVSILLEPALKDFEGDSRRLMNQKFYSWDYFWETNIFQSIIAKTAELENLDSFEGLVLSYEVAAELGIIADRKLANLKE